MRFTPGRSGNPAGMRVGTKHKTTAEVRALAQELFDRDYWRLKYERIHAGVENQKIEATLLSYAYGLPIKELHASGVIVHLGPLYALQEHHTLDTTRRDSTTTEAPPDNVLVAAIGKTRPM